MDGRRNRGTQKHAGVVLYSRSLPSGATAWRARYLDPDSQKKVHVTLPTERSGTEIERTAWAVAKAGEIRDRAKAIEGGAPTKKGGTLREAVAQYFTDVANLRPGTLRGYRDACDLLLQWTDEKRIALADELRGEHLMAFRAWLVNKPRKAPARGAGKGRKARVETATKRRPASVNRELRAIKTCLEHLRRLGLLPLVSRDAISDNLENLEQPRPVPAYLKPNAIAKLVEAAQRHDAETFELTREEKAAGLKGGETPCYSPILPYLAMVLLTGMRADEARSLRWERVDLEAPPAGVIELTPADTKTKIGRQVDLVVSNVLRELLATMKLRAGESVYVFGDARDEKGSVSPGLTPGETKAAYKRLMKMYGAPRYSWQRLRVTCGTFLANSCIFGQGNSAYRGARQLGHSVMVAEKHYLGVVHVDASAKTVEDAMGIAAKLRDALGLTASPSERAEASS